MGGGGAGGFAPLTAACALPFSVHSRILFLEHPTTTRQQTMMEKGIITVYSNIIHLGRFLDSLQNCWQPTAAHKSDAGVIKYKPSALLRNLCDSCMSARTLAPLMRALIRVRARSGEELRSERAHARSYTNRRAAEYKLTAHRLLNDTHLMQYFVIFTCLTDVLRKKHVSLQNRYQ